MSAIDYWDLRLRIKTAINARAGLETLAVFLEMARTPAPEEMPCVLLYMTGRTSPQEIQRIASGRRTDHRLIFSAWVLHYSLDGLEDATRRRDAVLAEVEMALMADRTLQGATRGLWLEGGDVQWGPIDPKVSQPIFATAIETMIVCDVHADL